MRVCRSVVLTISPLMYSLRFWMASGSLPMGPTIVM